MKKVKNSAELLWVFGIFFVALGVGLCSKADLGVSMIAAPAFVIYGAIAPLWSGFSVGVVEYLFQGALLFILCLVIRQFRLRYLLAFAAAVLYGYVLDLMLWIMRDFQPDEVWLRWMTLLIGDVFTAIGVACYFRTYLPLQVYELFVAKVSSVFGLPIHGVKWGFDGALLIISVSLAFLLYGDASSFDWSGIYRSCFHNIGLGTVVTTFINSPIIAFAGKGLDHLFSSEARFQKLKEIIKY